jgi:hypothetical protein
MNIFCALHWIGFESYFGLGTRNWGSRTKKAMNMKKHLVVSMLLLASVFGLVTSTQAGETVLLLEDTEDLPPPYKQWWYATPADHSAHNETYEVFIRGDGKHGDFFGILQVDCLNSKNTEWLATGGYLDTESVPAQAINALRLQLCDDDA